MPASAPQTPSAGGVAVLPLMKAPVLGSRPAWICSMSGTPSQSLSVLFASSVLSAVWSEVVFSSTRPAAFIATANLLVAVPTPPLLFWWQIVQCVVPSW